jgi:AcrR family transcriptional regulator
MRDIACAVGIKAGSIYSHFKSKSHLLGEMYDFFLEKQREIAPSLEKLLADAETKPIREVFMSLDYHFSDAEELMDRIVVVACAESRTDELSGEFVRKTYTELPKKYLGALLEKLIEIGRIEPMNVDNFLYIFSSVAFYTTMRLFTKYQPTVEQWLRVWETMFSMIKQK